MGSNPASSKITNSILQFKASPTSVIKLRYEFFFVSLLPLLHGKSKSSYERLANNLGDKIYLKKSYLIFLWLNYLASYQNDAYSVKVTKIRSKTKLYTVVKAPMAHKTNSKEQFISKHYHFKVQFTVRRSTVRHLSCQAVSTINVNLLSTFPVFETNLLFLTSAKIHTPLLLTAYLRR